jgi:acyl carrier protein
VMPAHDLLRRSDDEASQTDVDERLGRIFEATFPDLTPDAIATASVETTEQWDSLQSLVLMTLLEEEFGIAVSPVDLPELASYVAIRDYVLTAQST